MPAQFPVWEFRIEGASALPRMAIERAVYPFLGPTRSIADIEQARQALEQGYREAGFPTVLVDIPEQQVEGGVVRLAVTEGRVDRLYITGSRYYALGWIRAQVPALAPGALPQQAQVETELNALNRASAGLSVVPVLREGRLPGTVEVELQVKDELPLHGSVELNTRNTRNTSRTRLLGQLRYDNLWQRQHSASVNYQISPQEPDEVQVLSGVYAWPWGDAGRRLAVYAVQSESDSQIASAAALGVIGAGRIVGLRAILPVGGPPQAGGAWLHNVVLGLDYKDFRESIVLVGADALNTPIDYLNWSARYSASASREDSATELGAGVDFSVRGLASDAQEFEDKRLFARANYFYLSAQAQHRQELPFGLRALGRLAGQIASGPLISNEQYAIGGADSVRGYFETQALGDDGLSGTLELYSPRLFPSANLQELRVLAFLDGGRVSVRQPQQGVARRVNLAGAGLGLRLQAYRHLLADLDVAYALRDAEEIEAGDTRVHLRLGYEF